MPKEFQIPPQEGPVPSESSLLRIFDESDEELPVEIGSLEREAFSYIGDWLSVMDKEGYGFAYRLCAKEGLTDDEGDRATLVLHFAVPIKEKGKEHKRGIVEQKYEHLKTVVQLFTIQAQQKYRDNIVSVIANPPEWMLKDLEQLADSQ